MTKIYSAQNLQPLTSHLSSGQKLVLAGGCFDILHAGHLAFLHAAKSSGDQLVVLLESDGMIRKRKGPGRPINTQAERAKVLSHISVVDSVICLPEVTSHTEYARVIDELKPAIIATTAGDPSWEMKQAHAKRIGAELIVVIDLIPDISSSRYAQLIELDRV